jgi:NADPH:quinone reductase-like Zn-dependent oxidoreductase
MRAVIVNEYGQTPVVADVPKPEPRAGQVLIKVQDAGMNPMDRAIARGMFRDRIPGAFPMVLGADVAGSVESLGQGATRFSPGDEVFGQLMIPPLGSAGTYAEYVAVSEDAPLAHVPNGLDAVVAAALPTAGMTGLELVDLLGPLNGKTVLIIGAGGGVGSFATQFAANAGAHVIANVRQTEADRMRAYGAAETVDHTTTSVIDEVRKTHPNGIDGLIDLASDAKGFAALASLVRRGGTAISSIHVADPKALEVGGVTGINFELAPSSTALDRVADALVTKRIVAPPITRITLDQVPAVFGGTGKQAAEGKTVITL